MRKIFLMLSLCVFIFSAFAQVADAGRFGGGRSFGIQRSASSFARPSNFASRSGAQPSRWGSALTGLAMGGLLAYLFMGHGLGAGILTWLLIGVGVMLLVGFIKNLQRPAVTAARGAPQFSNQAYFNNMSTQTQNTDHEAFLRDAKVQFMRLQAAHDARNLNDIRAFTTPLVFGEIQMQMQEAPDQKQETKILSLVAEFLDTVQEGQTTTNSVRFIGKVQESEFSQPVDINEIWHFQKDQFATNWVVAGIQQA